LCPCQFGLLHFPNSLAFSASESCGLWTRWAALNRIRRVTVTRGMFRVRYRTRGFAAVIVTTGGPGLVEESGGCKKKAPPAGLSALITKRSSAGSTGGASERVGRRGFLKPGRIFEALTPPTVFPALGHDVSKVYWTHSKDLLAQKVSSPPQRLVPNILLELARY
jgi:hypothetical protein